MLPYATARQPTPRHRRGGFHIRPRLMATLPCRGAQCAPGPLCEGDSPQCGEMSRSDRGARLRKQSRVSGWGRDIKIIASLPF